MSHQYGHKPGQHLFTCDRCGCVYWSEKKRKEWTGVIVCSGPGTNNCWEPRHPQEFVRARPERQGVPDARPEQPDVSLDAALCLLEHRYGGAGVATAGCATVTDNPPVWE